MAHFTWGEGAGGLRSQKILASLLVPKTFMHTTSAQKTFTHVQRAENIMLRGEKLVSYTHASQEKIPSAWKSLKTYACTESQNLSLNVKCQMVHPLATHSHFGHSMYTMDMVKRQSLAQLLQVRQSVNKNRIFRQAFTCY